MIEGYATIGAEIADRPDLVAVQIGVGSFAAAMVRRFAPARIVGVEPLRRRARWSRPRRASSSRCPAHTTR